MDRKTLMENYNKRILLCVTGMSPAVITETLYALVVEKNFIPTEIRVITTQQGKNKVINALLGITSDRQEKRGALADFIADYGQQYGFEHIHFDEQSVQVIEDSQTQKLSDIRSPEENQLAADQIVKLVGELCQDDASAIHVSIAGGRKTMGFFLGYALSLYGRKQDSLSHVLVSEQFENLPDFFYPKPYPHIIYNHKGEELDASKGKVMLAEIPWVRLGLGVPENLLNSQISYSDSVHKAQMILDEPKLTFLGPIDKRLVRFGEIEVTLSPKGYTLMLSLVLAKLKDLDFNLYKHSQAITELYLGIYEMIKIKDDRMHVRLKEDDDLIKVISESRTNINNEVRRSFSIGKEIKTPYIPNSKNTQYELLIDIDNIDISQIKPDLSHLL